MPELDPLQSTHEVLRYGNLALREGIVSAKSYSAFSFTISSSFGEVPILGARGHFSRLDPNKVFEMDFIGLKFELNTFTYAIAIDRTAGKTQAKSSFTDRFSREVVGYFIDYFGHVDMPREPTLALIGRLLLDSPAAKDGIKLCKDHKTTPEVA